MPGSSRPGHRASVSEPSVAFLLRRVLLPSRQCCPDVHQRITKQVEAVPLVRIQGARIVCGEPDRPHPIHRAGFHEHPVARTTEEFLEVLVLGEFGDASGHDDAGAPVAGSRRSIFSPAPASPGWSGYRTFPPGSTRHERAPPRVDHPPQRWRPGLVRLGPVPADWAAGSSSCSGWSCRGTTHGKVGGYGPLA
jgi:hypothetical protein